MNYRRFWATVALGGAALVGSASLYAGSRPELVRGPGTPTLSSEVAEGATVDASTRTAVISATSELCRLDVGRLAGASVSSATFRDTDPLGESSGAVIVWLVRIPRLRVFDDQSGQLVWLDVSVVMDQGNGRLLAAYTDPKSQWVLPDKVGEDLGEELERIYRGNIGPCTEPLQSSLQDVLVAIWRHSVDLIGAGQLVLRPRAVVSSWPPREGMSEGTPRVFWIVHVAGTLAWLDDAPHPKSGPSYSSGRVLLVLDAETLVTAEHFLR